jgi:hypothetical protein
MAFDFQEGDIVRWTSSAGSTEVEVVKLPTTPFGMVKVRGENGHELHAPADQLHPLQGEEGIAFQGRSDPRVGSSEDAAFDQGSNERGRE